MIKKQSFKIDHGTYAFDILVFIGYGIQEVINDIEVKIRRKLSEAEKDILVMQGFGRTIIFSSGQTILRLERLDDKADSHSKIAHELFHTVELLFEHVGIGYDVKTSSEAFAYQIGYVTWKFYSKVK